MDDINQLKIGDKSYNVVDMFAVPVGSVISFAGDTAPDRYLICDGTAISRTEYALLFAVIGTKYGSGDGETTFNLPNLTQRFIMGGTTVGAVGGEATHTLTIDEMPTHFHRDMQWGENSGNYFGVNSSGSPVGTWQFSYSGTASQANFYTDRRGGSQPHNNLPPYITMKYIIRYE